METRSKETVSTEHRTSRTRLELGEYEKNGESRGPLVGLSRLQRLFYLQTDGIMIVSLRIRSYCHKLRTWIFDGITLPL
ncbi:hypothetical protein CDL15_Pgr012850 [Punica granatum]|uniref:Uncharacterized protein n=1 Tax=Punica granatum TaxID=22663 RepID=A0A218XF98_PUNGR|nr:hypothetical protein CDL15_Pgr012850 [Punica granatum]PKI66363.1 hypothetical protein CRG98_013165 [Punica granatum]